MRSLGRRSARELWTPGRFRPDQPPADPLEQGRLRRRHPHLTAPFEPFEFEENGDPTDATVGIYQYGPENTNTAVDFQAGQI